MQYHPQKFFVNFLIRIKNQKKVQKDDEQHNLIYGMGHVRKILVFLNLFK